MLLKEYTCCFFGHRKITVTDELVDRLYRVIEDLIINEKINTFLFGSKSEFDTLCLSTVTKIKNKYHNIKLIYVRAEFPNIDDSYKEYLLERYDETYYPKQVINSGRLSYIKRNYEMIDNSKYCVVYFDRNYTPPKKTTTKSTTCNYKYNSGTKLAYEYAEKKNLQIINLFDTISTFTNHLNTTG